MYKKQYYWNKRSGPYLDITVFFFRMSTQVKAEVRERVYLIFLLRNIGQICRYVRKKNCENTGLYHGPLTAVCNWD
jgi:hypothetical protein